jgi:hypothetical protein
MSGHAYTEDQLVEQPLHRVVRGAAWTVVQDGCGPALTPKAGIVGVS